jgi:hypothetical protein
MEDMLQFLKAKRLYPTVKLSKYFAITEKITTYQSIYVGEPLCGLLKRAATESRPYGIINQFSSFAPACRSQG